MRKPLALLGAASVVALLVPASAVGGAFTSGSAKTETEAVAGLEHLSFTAHSVLSPTDPCRAKGSAVYNTADLLIKVDVDILVIQGPRAVFSGLVAWANPALPPSPIRAQFTVFDREAVEGVTDVTLPTDAFQFDGFLPPNPICPAAAGLASHLVTQGNIVIKSTGPLLFP